MIRAIKRNNFGKSNYFSAALIAGGGLSGGISSTIAGGSFWEGARQGVMVSALNHLAHWGAEKIEESKWINKIDNELEKAGYEPYGKTEWTAEYAVEMMKKVPVLKKLLTKKFTVWRNTTQLVDDEGKPVNGVTTHNEKGYATVKLSPSAYTTNSRLALTLGHEMNHVADYYTGRIKQWFDHGKNTTAESEVKAWNWSKEWGYFSTHWKENLPIYELQIKNR